MENECKKSNKSSVLVLAIYKNRIDLIKTWLDNGIVDINERVTTTGIRFDDILETPEEFLDLTEGLIDHLGLLNRCNNAFTFACTLVRIEIVELLLTYGARDYGMKLHYHAKIQTILANHKRYLPRWNRFGSCKIYPREFTEIALHWVWCCKRIKPRLPKDLRFLMVEYIAENWKLEKNMKKIWEQCLEQVGEMDRRALLDLMTAIVKWNGRYPELDFAIQIVNKHYYYLEVTGYDSIEIKIFYLKFLGPDRMAAAKCVSDMTVYDDLLLVFEIPQTLKKIS